MKIAKIEFKGFMGLDDQTLDLAEKVSLFVGPNFSGKTSIIQGIRAAITGTIPGLARKDVAGLSNRQDLKRPTWSVTIHPEKDGKVPGCITRTPTTLKASKATTGEEANVKQDDVYRVLGADPDVLDACLDLSKLPTMSATERRVLLLRVAGVKVDRAALVEKGITDEAVLEQALAGNWRKAETIATERKRSRNREADAAGGEAPDAPTVNVKGQDVSAADVPDSDLQGMQKALRALESKETELQRRLGALSGKSEGKLEEYEKRLAQLRGERSEIDLDGLSENLMDSKKALGDLREEMRKASENHAALVATQEHEEDRAADMATRVQRAKNANEEHECWCGNKHKGSVTDADVEAMEADLAAQEKKVDEAAQKAQAAKDTLDSMQATESDLSSAVSRLSEQVKAVEELDRKIEKGEAAVAKLKEEIEKQDSDEAKAVEEELEKLRTKLSRGRETVQAIVSYRQAVEDAEASRGRVKVLRAEAEAYEAMEKLCRPDGVQKDLVQPLIERLQELVAPWCAGLNFDVTVDSEFEIVVGDRPFVALSGAEKWMVGLALSAALAQISGLRFLALDEAAVLDAERKRFLSGLLAKAKGEFDQVIVLMPLGERGWPTQVPLDDITLYHVRDGKVLPAPAAKKKGAAA